MSDPSAGTIPDPTSATATSGLQFTPAQSNTTSGVTSPTTGAPTSQGDAMSIIQDQLNQWGLGSLATQAWGWITSGMGLDQIMQSIRSTPEYAAKYPGMALRQQNGYPAMSEAQYLAYEQTVLGAAQQAGLPSGFLTTQEIGQLVGQNVDATQFSERVQKGYEAAMLATPEVRQTLDQWFGTGQTNGMLAAYYLDPSKALPILEQQLTQAQINAQAERTGYGAITQDQALALAQSGVTEAAAQKGFGDLAHQQQLFTPLPGQNSPVVTQSQQFGAEFANNAADQLAISNAQQARQGEFKGGGGFAQSQQGISGIGVATPT
jgi:hypothetical protein